MMGVVEETMILGMGAEAIVSLQGRKVVKYRPPKRYRIKELDYMLRRERTRSEAKLMSSARRLGVPTPIIYGADECSLEMEYIDGDVLRECINEEIARLAGKVIGHLHEGGIVHGDLTTSNFLFCDGRVYLIDFGLAVSDKGVEAQGMDIHLYIQSVRATHLEERLVTTFIEGYRSVRGDKVTDEVLSRVADIERRGRYL